VQDIDIERVMGVPPRVAFADIVGHPRMPEARRIYIDRFLEVYDGDPFVVRLLLESGRVLVYLIVTVLEAAQDPARRETWVTVGLLKKTIALFGLASGRQIDHLVARLCEVGYMELRPSEQDRRVRILSPTEKMRAHDREWLVAHFAPLTILYPQHDYGPVMRREPQIQAAHRRAALPILPLAAEILQSGPDMMLFLNRAAGYPILAALLQAAMRQGGDAPVAVPYVEIGDRFGVSRTHIRALLTDAETSGLVKLHARGGRSVEILPRLWASHDRGMAGGMYMNDIIYVAATWQLRAATA
jgi:hypothetical protein